MTEKLLLYEIRDLAYRFVPAEAADDRLYACGHRSWWPAHEIGHFLVATPAECRQRLFGIDKHAAANSARYRYVVAREVAAMSISQRLLRRSGHVALADEEVQYTDENTLDCSFERWCRSTVRRLLFANHAARLPRTRRGLESLLTRKAREAGTATHTSRRAAARALNRGVP